MPDIQLPDSIDDLQHCVNVEIGVQRPARL
jgi:hypothetical protein